MSWQYPPFILFLVPSGIISAALAFYAWQRRPLPGTVAFALLMLAVAEWSLIYAVGLTSTVLPVARFWDKAVYLGTVTIGPAWLIFVLQYTGRGKWLPRRRIALLTIIPLVTLALVWTNEAHNLIYTWAGFETIGSFLIFQATFGPWFWVHLAYTYVLLLIGTLFLFRSLLSASTLRLYRGQFVAVLLGVLAPWVTSILEIIGWGPFSYPIDLVPFAFTLTGLTVTWGLFSFRFLDVIPIARDAVVEGMSDGMIVLDAQNRLLDMNPAIQAAIDLKPKEVIGQPVSRIFSRWPEVVECLQNVTQTRIEICLPWNHTNVYYDVRITPLSRQGHFVGRVILFRDITDQKQREEEREKLIAELQTALAQVKQLRDLLPICASCKKIRNDEGYWQEVEEYIYQHVEVQFSHGICPDCAKELYPEFFAEISEEEGKSQQDE